MPSWRLTPLAEDDVRHAAQQTVVFWGLDQSVKYINEIYAVFDRLADFPQTGRARPDLGAGTRGWPVRSHVVFYRVESDAIEIVRVLHGHEDAEAAFRDT